MERCTECGFEYNLDLASSTAAAIRDGAADVSAMLRYGAHGVGARSRDGSWSPLEYACHLRDVLLIQRERILLARQIHEPRFLPMGRDLRAEHDGYIFQDPLDVARQLVDAAQLLGNTLDRMAPEEWERKLVYPYPEPELRTLRWLTLDTAHEVRHHQLDIHRSLR